jgi:Tfp pilus assembly protein PilF/DNA-binding transcriptional MerR regulator
MQSYSVRDIERVLRLSRSTIRGLIDVGFVKPTRGPRREYRFSFQDLIVLRAARALIQAKVSRRRIRRSLEDLRRHLPQTMPLSGLSICAVGDRVVVRDGKSHWQVDSGQYVLGLDVSVQDGVLRVVERTQESAAHDWAGSAAKVAPFASDVEKRPDGVFRQKDMSAAKVASFASDVEKRPDGVFRQNDMDAAKVAPFASDIEKRPDGVFQQEEMAAEDWFNDGLDLEETDPAAALEAYQHTVSLDPQNVAAWINWGRLLHDGGNKREAESVYRRAVEQCGPDSVLMFNLGVLLEDLGRTTAAVEAYQAAVGEDPNLADCHYNLARLYESLGKPQHAIRHLGQYRRLVTSEPR